MNPDGDVLVIEDEPVVCDAIRLVLGAEGLRVEAVASAEEALAHPALASCRLAICDLMLPGRSGLDAVRDLHAARPGLPILMITGFSTRANAELALQAGAWAFLPKPFDDSELLSLVRQALERAPDAGKEVRS